MTLSYHSTPVHFEELDEMVKALLGTTANELACETSFVQRHSAMDGAHFVQALVIGLSVW